MVIHNICRYRETGTGFLKGDNKRNYIITEEFVQRLLDEKSQLDERIGKLKPFIEGEMFAKIAPEQQVLLNKQLPIMEEYSSILAQRLEDLSLLTR